MPTIRILEHAPIKESTQPRSSRNRVNLGEDTMCPGGLVPMDEAKYLRFLRNGTTSCPTCGDPVTDYTIEE